ncbi:unnamed protein product [Orchesella dallaii]|uniref:Thiamine transporter 2 n=1 Tax=Orchesella dallaii TaxID=48710 RepID=A0ABP1QIC8_9HEXA
MEKWQWVSLILCLFGIFKEFRPSEPFVTEFLIEYKNFTKETVVQQIYPLGTYFYLGTLPIVFLITDYLRYKSIIILEGLAFVGVYILLIWGNGINNARVFEFLFGIACSTEVAYYTYIYAKVDKEHYKKVTSFTYTATLVGNFLAAVVAQALVSSKLMNYRELNFLTLTSVSICLGIAFFLPSVKQSIYFHRKPDTPSITNGSIQNANSIVITPDDAEGTPNLKGRLSRAYRLLWADFTTAYSNPYIVKWSVWWAISSAGFLQIINYIQPLWEDIAAYTENEIYNGAVDAVHTILSALLAILVGHISIPWRKWGESLLCVISLLQGFLLLWMSQTETLMVAYVGYIIFRTLYQVMITVASAEVANNITGDSSGLIFGINRFVALLLQSFLTFAVADKGGLALGLRPQFNVYGGYFFVLGGIFAVVVGVTGLRHGFRRGSSSEVVANGGPEHEIVSLTKNNGIAQL